jgi:hypothetical protein
VCERERERGEGEREREGNVVFSPQLLFPSNTGIIPPYFPVASVKSEEERKRRDRIYSLSLC